VARSNLTTRLTKELRRSPKKTAVLALMLVVALWFWAPLAWKWVAPQASDAAASSALSPPAGVEMSTSTARTAPATGSATVPVLNWREMAALLENDPLLASARMHERLADPFAKPNREPAISTTEQRETEISAPETAQAKPTPEQLGLTLASTITGGSRAVATISGKSCRVGDVIVVPGGGVDFEFTVVAIQVNEVTLAAGGELHVLSSRRPDSTMQLSQAGALPSTKQANHGQRIVIGPRLGE
jgi:hypothetical protein